MVWRAFTTAAIWLCVTGCADASSDPADDTASSTSTASETSASIGGDDGSAATSSESLVTSVSDASDDGPGDDSSEGGGETSGTGGAVTDDPDLPGPSTHTVASFDLPITGGTLPLTLYLPDEAGPLPAVVFTHGFQLGPANYATYGAHLASWGYVVVMPQMPGSIFAPVSHATLRDYVVAIIDWIEADGGNVSGPLLGLVDGTQIALAGHSMGGKVSLLTAAADARPSLVVGIDPVDTPGGPGVPPSPENPSVTPELMPQITARLVLVGEMVNATGGVGGMPCAPEAENFRQYFTHATSPALEIEFVTANHMSFLDNPNCGLSCDACSPGTDSPAMTLLMTRGYLVAALEAYLRGDAAYEPWLTGAPMQSDVDSGLVATATANGF